MFIWEYEVGIIYIFGISDDRLIGKLGKSRNWRLSPAYRKRTAFSFWQLFDPVGIYRLTLILVRKEFWTDNYPVFA